MILPRAIRRVAALAATFGIALQALWPLVSHAGPKDRSLLAPLCTVDGVTHYQEIRLGKTPLEQRSAQHGEHCKLCVFGDGKHVVPAAPDFLPFLFKDSSQPYPALRRTSFRQATLRPSQPRAPPQIS